MSLSIAQLGQPVLRRRAVAVAARDVAGAAFQQLIDDMLATAKEHRGAGLAGPQVFAGQRLFVARVLPPREGDEREMGVFINPVVTPLTRDLTLAWEGCLSFPELLVLVPRVVQVRMEYLDREGQRRTLELADWPARIVQHEQDHLDGILTLDRAPDPRYIIKASEIEAATQDLLPEGRA
jgi:peptide deformylase